MNIWIKKFPESWHPAHDNAIYAFSCSPSGVQTYRILRLEAPSRDSSPADIGGPYADYQKQPRGAP